MWKVREDNKVPSYLKEVVKDLVEDLNMDDIPGDWDYVSDTIVEYTDELQRHPSFDRVISLVGFTKAYNMVVKSEQWADEPKLISTTWGFMYILLSEAFTQCAYYE